jgi:alpha-mannosidase
MSALDSNPDRKFTYVEQAFFTRWWNEQSEKTQSRVKALVKSGQLSFVNGGWCMHDEAAAHYIGMMDQTKLGHDFLKETFDYVPSVGWQMSVSINALYHSHPLLIVFCCRCFIYVL